MFLLLIFLGIYFLAIPEHILAGNIDPNNDGSQFAYGENVGWINLEPSGADGVEVLDDALSGYAWGENIGWISFSCFNKNAACNPVAEYGVINDGAGNLSGFAWSENAGWINFAPTGAGVSIDPATGIFSGAAWGENIGWISFNSTGTTPYQVVTLWGTPANNPPLANAGTDQTVEATSPSGASVTLNGGGSSDPDTGDTLTFSWSGPFGTAGGISPIVTFPLGINNATLTVEDSGNLTATDDVQITVQDTTPPSLTAPADVTPEANGNPNSTVSLGAPTASDFFLDTVTNNAPADFPLGLTVVVTWTATDTSNNSATATQNVKVQDTTAPSLIAPPDKTVEATGPTTEVSLGTPTASDLFLDTVTNDAPAAFPLGTTVVTWTATDTSGNSTTAIQNITVEDTTPSEFTFGGFLSPLKDGGTYKLGRTLPVKFQLFFADGSPATTATATLQLQMLSGSEPTGDPIIAESSSAADSGNTFRLSDSKYIYNLSTEILTVGTYQIQVDIGDGTVQSMVIGLK